MSATRPLNQRRLRRLLRAWLADPKACVLQEDGSLRISGHNGRAALMPADLVQHGMQQGLLEATGTGEVIPAAPAEQWCKRQEAIGDDPFAAQHRDMVCRDVFDAAGKCVQVQVNLAQSPLMRLYRQRDGQGQRLIHAAHLAAGEKLREDYALSGMGRVSASDWTGLPASHRTRGARPGLSSTEMAMDARKRVMDALQSVGPVLDRLLFAILIREENLSDQEQAHHWPARSGRIMLQLALTRLAGHYGLPI